ncbi:hypothetical protein OUZ56_012823 [Daphnia magna]|uniref:Uncharacterized protein n=1 Tax=Daphnia magna TaxID=35525 RepID=A0ABQ9Z4A2_9CRUS|nr:hypothetical protein OUZ56_012823 [Daphnia magna]
MAADHFAIIMEMVRSKNERQQQLLAQNQQRALDSGPSLPTHSGKREEDVQASDCDAVDQCSIPDKDTVLDFVETINREPNVGNWPEPQKMRLAKAALREIAAEWRWLHDAEVHHDWAGWSTTLCSAFRKRYTFAEWEKSPKAAKKKMWRRFLAHVTQLQHCNKLRELDWPAM